MKMVFASAALALLAIPLSATAAAAQAAPAAQSEDAAKLAEAHAIIEIIFPPARRDEMLDKMLTALTAQMRTPFPAYLTEDAGVKNILEDYMKRVEAAERPLLSKHMPAMMEATAVAYTHEFSLAELKDIHSFGKTPSGQRYLSRASALLSDPAVAKVNKELAAEAQELPKSFLPELDEKLGAYMKAHPDVAAKIAAASRAN